MDSSVHDIKPRPPRPAKFEFKLETIERLVKIILQCTAIATFLAGTVVAIAECGGKAMKYAAVIYKAVKEAHDGVDATTVVGETSEKEITITYTYTVRKNDQLLDLCLHHQMSVNQLLDLNPHVVDPDKIEANKTRLRLRAKCYHIVKPGDILKVVAKKYDVTVKELMRANYKPKNNAVRGEKLLIPYHVRP